MKTCSKCKKDLPRDRFVKSPRYLDGLYPICKGCRKATRLAALLTNPMCSHCKKRPHSGNHAWCDQCQRLERGSPLIPKFRRDTTNKTLCSRCRTKPKAKGHNYCRECKNTSRREWAKRHGGNWKALGTEQRQKCTARKYAYNLVKRGRLQAQPCEVCGSLKAEIHHLNYNRMTLDIRWLCKKHHDEAERVKKSLLTEQPLLL